MPNGCSARWVSYSRLGSLGRDRLTVVGLERLGDLGGVVDEIQDEGPVLVGVGTVQPGQESARSEAGERLVDVHRIAWVGRTRFELLSHDQEPVGVGVEAGSRLGVGEPVELSASVTSSPSSLTVPENATSTPRS